jgi:hypothetical protein
MGIIVSGMIVAFLNLMILELLNVGYKTFQDYGKISVVGIILSLISLLIIIIMVIFGIK